MLNLTNEQKLALVRHILTGVGAILASHKWTAASSFIIGLDPVQVLGIVTSLVGIVSSHWVHKPETQTKQTNNEKTPNPPAAGS